MKPYFTPCRFNARIFDHFRPLLGDSFVAYVGNGYSSHERLRDEIAHDAADAAVFIRCDKLGMYRTGAWDHNFYWATVGLSEADRDEVWWSRANNREPEFEV